MKGERNLVTPTPFPLPQIHMPMMIPMVLLTTKPVNRKTVVIPTTKQVYAMTVSQ